MDMKYITMIGATWCSPCKALKQRWYDPLHEEFPEQTEIIYADIDVTAANRVLGRPVRHIPTVIFTDTNLPMKDICTKKSDIWTLEEVREWLKS